MSMTDLWEPPAAARRHDGLWAKRFVDGDSVRIYRENRGSVCDSSYNIDPHGIPTGAEVELLRFDEGDNTWLVRDPKSTCEVWVFQDCLSPTPVVTDEDVEEAITSIKMGMHPDLLRMLAYEEDAIAQGYKDGDVNHYVQPVIGILRMKLQSGDPIDRELLEYVVDRMLKACKAETAWLKQRERER